jgi:hypothetical protein
VRILLAVLMLAGCRDVSGHRPPPPMEEIMTFAGNGEEIRKLQDGRVTCYIYRASADRGGISCLLVTP